jgi:hypothetical protein
LANVPPAKRPEVRLNPALQERLLKQMRQEQASAIRSRRIKVFVLVPAVIVAMVVSTMLAFSPDQTTSMIGSTLASSLLLLFWKLRKRIGAGLGLG